MPDPEPIPAWTETLIAFLRSETGLEAVRVDPAERRVSVATLGEVDEQVLRRRLGEILEKIEKQIPTDTTEAIEVGGGYLVEREGTQTEVADRPAVLDLAGILLAGTGGSADRYARP